VLAKDDTIDVKTLTDGAFMSETTAARCKEAWDAVIAALIEAGRLPDPAAQKKKAPPKTNPATVTKPATEPAATETMEATPPTAETVETTAIQQIIVASTRESRFSGRLFSWVRHT
jgi:hypothetical protein